MMDINIKITKQWTENDECHDMTLFLVSGPGFNGYMAVDGKDRSPKDVKTGEGCWVHLMYGHGHQFSFIYHERAKIVNAVYLPSDPELKCRASYEFWLTKDAFDRSHITFHFNEGKKQDWGHVFVYEQDRPKRSFGNRAIVKGNGVA